MRHYPLEKAARRPVTHDPELEKTVLVEDRVSCMAGLSHIALVPGNTARAHSHSDAHEVFYCIEGSVDFGVGDSEVRLSAGDCLVVEPGEVHSIKRVIEETRLLYFFALSGG